MSVEVVLHEGVPGGELRAAWDQLVAADPDANIFHSPRYLEVWHRELGQAVTPRVRTVVLDGELVGLVPEARELEGSPTGPRELLQFLGGSDVTDYLGPISRREHRELVARAYLHALASDRGWDEFIASGLSVDSGWVDAFRAEMDGAGLTILEDTIEEVCPRVDLAGGYDAYLGRLGGKQRHELRRKGRKLARDAGDVELQLVAAGELEKGLASFFDMATEGEDDKSRFFVNDDMRRFFTALADEFAAEGTFRLHVLNVAGAPGAATVSFVQDGEWLLYNSSFDETLRHLAPGMVLVGELIRVAAEDEACAVFDLLRGDEPYKYRFGAEDREIRRLAIARTGA